MFNSVIVPVGFDHVSVTIRIVPLYYLFFMLCILCIFFKSDISSSFNKTNLQVGVNPMPCHLLAMLVTKMYFKNHNLLWIKKSINKHHIFKVQ